ncbi:N-6 DNA methylase [Helicobacter pylori]
MAIKKSELYSSLWAGADSLRGGMDASEYKNYVLNLLFLKYISDKARNNSFSEIEVPQGCFYEDILALEGDKEIGDKLNKIIAKIAKRNELEGVIDSVDFNDNTKLGEGKAMIDTLSNLVKIFADLSLGAHGALEGYIKGVIGLAPNLFYGTSIPACVIVLDKENAHARKGVFMIDASKDFKKDGNKNRLREQDVQKMIDTFNALKEIPYYSKMVSLEEISANDYNLNIPRYIAAKQESEKDLFALINSHKASYLPKNEIEAYAPYFQVFKELKNTLFKKSDKEGYYALKTECENIKELITQSSEYQTFHASVLDAFDRLELLTTFNDLEPGFNPKTLIESVCSKVLYEFEKVEILDKYGVYQLFKDYYNEVLQDDWFFLSFNGFISAKELRKLTPLKDKNKKANYLEEPDFVIQKTYYKSDLIPKHLIKQRFFEKETKELEELENALNEKETLLDEFIEEHSNEEGLFDGLKINESVLKKELKNATDLEDKQILKTALEWLEAKNKALKMKNKAYEELELKAFHQYKNLEINEIKDLIIKDKWLNSLKNALENKILKRINAFASTLNEIISSYSNSLLELDKEVKESESKVLEHLKDLGLMGW